MKTKLIVLLVIVMGMTMSCQKKIDVAKEEEAIKTIIEAEINASFNGEYEKWAAFFVQEPYLVWMQAWKEGYSCMKGWQNIGTSAKKWVIPERRGSLIFKGNQDYTFRIYGDAAFVSFTCKSARIVEGQEKETEAIEARFLEKHDGIWKIVCLGSVYTSTYKEAVQN
jgi:hypothetical protein